MFKRATIICACTASLLAACAPGVSEPARPSAAALAACPDPNAPVRIPDAVLERELMQELSSPDSSIACVALASARKLQLDEGVEGARIASLRGLERAAGLRTLEVVGHALEDLSPLAGLEDLIVLSLDQNDIPDITPLAGVSELQWLELAGNAVSDLSPLAGLTRLATLDLSGNDIEDIGPLAGLTRLRLLRLSKNDIEDIAPLGGLEQVGLLALDGNRIRDLSPLARLPGLQLVDVSDNMVTDVEVLLYNFDLGPRTSLDLSDNCLELSAGSRDLRAIEELKSRGVRVTYEPQKPCGGP